MFFSWLPVSEKAPVGFYLTPQAQKKPSNRSRWKRRKRFYTLYMHVYIFIYLYVYIYLYKCFKKVINCLWFSFWRGLFCCWGFFTFPPFSRVFIYLNEIEMEIFFHLLFFLSSSSSSSSSFLLCGSIISWRCCRFVVVVVVVGGSGGVLCRTFCFDRSFQERNESSSCHPVPFFLSFSLTVFFVCVCVAYQEDIQFKVRLLVVFWCGFGVLCWVLAIVSVVFWYCFGLYISYDSSTALFLGSIIFFLYFSGLLFFFLVCLSVFDIPPSGCQFCDASLIEFWQPWW